MENYDYMYNDTYEVFTNAPFNTDPNYTLVLVSLIVAILLVLAVSLAHIVICVSVPKVRADPSKWLQLLVVLSISSSAIIAMAFTWGKQTGLNKIWTASGLCEVVQPLFLALKLLITIGLNLVSLERLVTLWKDKAAGSAFSQRATAILLAVTVGVTLVLSYSLIYGFGGVSNATFNGINFCVYDSASDHVINVLNEVGILIMLILTLFLVVRLCKTNCCGEGRYLLDKVLPVSVGNVLYIVMEGLMFARVVYIEWTFIMLFIAILVIWLLGESDLRRPLTRTCCPCCPPEQDDEKRPILPQ